ncbi:DUF2807 domain-containing protein [Polaribacter sp.]|nr:DUF2807 domain-containing protein [Polaribacter sp.]
MKKKLYITGILLSLTFGLQAQNWFGGKNKIKGNGNVITASRKVASFEGVNLSGSFEVLLVKGEEGKITIEAEKNIIPYIETVVKGKHLKIQYQKNTNISTTKKVTVTVYFSDLESVSIGGSGKISSTNPIKASNFEVNIGGSGKIILEVIATKLKASIGGSGNLVLSGKTKELNCKIAGSGSIKSYALITEKLFATIAGSGNIKTTVKTKMKIKVAGSGNIYYKGNPKQIDTKIVGSGDVIDRN